MCSEICNISTILHLSCVEQNFFTEWSIRKLILRNPITASVASRRILNLILGLFLIRAGSYATSYCKFQSVVIAVCCYAIQVGVYLF